MLYGLAGVVDAVVKIFDDINPSVVHLNVCISLASSAYKTNRPPRQGGVPRDNVLPTLSKSLVVMSFKTALGFRIHLCSDKECVIPQGIQFRSLRDECNCRHSLTLYVNHSLSICPAVWPRSSSVFGVLRPSASFTLRLLHFGIVVVK